VILLLVGIILPYMGYFGVVLVIVVLVNEEYWKTTDYADYTEHHYFSQALTFDNFYWCIAPFPFSRFLSSPFFPLFLPSFLLPPFLHSRSQSASHS